MAQTQQERAGKGWEAASSRRPQGEGCHMSHFNTAGLLAREGRAGHQTSPTTAPSVSHRNALVCSHDHLTLFLTLVSGLEFIRFDLDLVRPRGSPGFRGRGVGGWARGIRFQAPLGSLQV